MVFRCRVDLPVVTVTVRTLLLLAFADGAGGLAAQPAGAVPPPPADSIPFCCDTQRFAPMAAEVLTLQLIPWYFNRNVAVDSTAVLSVGAWRRNLVLGFEWDPGNFETNMFMHPVHGNLYFNAGRTNGYSFFESSALAWAGSLMWEMFGENNRPAINDWINTSMGGITIGEVVWRGSRALLDNRATGTARAWRELGHFFVNPVGAFNRLWRGETMRVGANPDGRFPSSFRSALFFGIRSVGDTSVPESGRNIPYVDLRFAYGDHLRDLDHPFDAFTVHVEINGSRAHTVARVRVDGTLYGKLWKESARARHVFGVEQHYDYFNNETYVVGGQSFGVTLRSRFRLRDPLTLQTLLEPFGAAIWAVSSEYADVTGRDYDFGSGAGVRTKAELFFGDANVLSLAYTGVYSHTLNGAVSNHLLHMVSVGLQAPILKGFGGAMEFVLFARNSFYRDFDDVHERTPLLRWSMVFFP